MLKADVIKELMKLIPKYDGSGGIQKLIEYVEGFQRYSDAASEGITRQTELTLATAKLTGDAALWWREHQESVPVADKRRIRTWEELKKALFETFAPADHENSIREKLKYIKQKSTVMAYTAEFRKLTMQLPDIGFKEAQFAGSENSYVRGATSRT